MPTLVIDIRYKWNFALRKNRKLHKIKINCVNKQGNKYILLLSAAIYHITTAYHSSEHHSSEPESFKHKKQFTAFRSDSL